MKTPFEVEDSEKFLEFLPREVETIIPNSVTHFGAHLDLEVSLVLSLLFGSHLRLKHHLLRRLNQAVGFFIILDDIRVSGDKLTQLGPEPQVPLVVLEHFDLVALTLGHVNPESVFDEGLHVLVVALYFPKDKGRNVESTLNPNYALLEYLSMPYVVLHIRLVVHVVEACYLLMRLDLRCL